MEIIESENLTFAQKEAVRKLWNQEYPKKLMLQNAADFENYLQNLNGKRHLLVLNDLKELAGWAFLFERNLETWFAIILDAKIQKKGFGNLLLSRLKARETQLNGWVIDHNNDFKQDGSCYVSPLNFYIKNGFVAIPEIRLETDKISAVKIEWKQER